MADAVEMAAVVGVTSIISGLIGAVIGFCLCLMSKSIIGVRDGD